MFQTCELLHRCALFDGQCILVNPCIYPIIAHNLSTIQFSVCRRESNLDVHLKATRIVTGMRTVVNGGRQIGYSHLLQSLCRQTRRSYREIKYFGDRSADSSLIVDTVTKHHVVCYDTCLAIGWTCQEIEPRFARNRMRVFNGIPYGINIRIRSLQIGIYPDTTHFTEFQSSFLRQTCLCTYANA